MKVSAGEPSGGTLAFCMLISKRCRQFRSSLSAQVCIRARANRNVCFLLTLSLVNKSITWTQQLSLCINALGDFSVSLTKSKSSRWTIEELLDCKY